MSDAITLDVLSSSPVQLDVGDADPIAREEIAALAGRVTTVEGDVSGLSTRMGAVEGDVTALDGRMDAAEGDISTLGTTVDGIDARVEAIEADYVTSEDVRDALGGEAPALVSGSSRAVLGDPETASWMQRTTAADGAALIEAVYGNTVVQDGSLLPVRMEGVETVGFNQWDEVWELGKYSASTGEKVSDTNLIRCANPIPVLPWTAYYMLCPYTDASTGFFVVLFYDADGGFLSSANGRSNGYAFTTPSNAHYLTFFVSTLYGTTYKNDICINLSDPSRNGTYEPYWRSERAIPVATYFPDGMRGVGTGDDMVCDELTNHEAIHRIGEVDLGTLTWTYVSDGAYFYAIITDKAKGFSNIRCAKYETAAQAGVSNLQNGQIIGGNNYTAVYIKDTAYTDAATFKAAMSGVMLHYALATPTTTPIDPPLPLSYRTGAGGTERVMVASGTTSAPPIFATRYPLDPADLAASIAPVDGPIAEANHQVGDLVMLGWTLCKVTTAIARGEAITIGTNVTRTSVAAELAAIQ